MKTWTINYRALRWASIIGFVFYIVGAFCVYPLSKDLAISMGFVGLAADMRSETEGRAIWGTEFERFDQVPKELGGQVIRDARKRKGLKLEPQKPEDFME